MNRTFLVFLLTLFYCCLILIIDELIAIKFRNIVMMRRRKVCTYEEKRYITDSGNDPIIFSWRVCFWFHT